MKKALMVALISILLLSSAGYAEIEIIDLGTLGGANSSVGLIPLNNLGQVTGYSTTSNGQTHAFLWTYEQGMQPLYETWGTYSAA
jgi:probable HAF family extracellular repeat protein